MQLATDRLILRELVEDDWRAVHAIESIPDVVRYQTFAPRSEDDARVCEAHFIQNVWIKGEWCDSLNFAMLDHEWAAR